MKMVPGRPSTARMTLRALRDPLHPLHLGSMTQARGPHRHDSAWAGLDCDDPLALGGEAEWTARPNRQALGTPETRAKHASRVARLPCANIVSTRIFVGA